MPLFNAIYVIHEEVENYDEQVRDLLTENPDLIILIEKENRAYQLFYMVEGKQITANIVTPKEENKYALFSKLDTIKESQKISRDPDSIYQIESILKNNIKNELAAINKKIMMQWYDLQENPRNDDLQPGFLYLQIDADNLGFNYTALNKLPSKKNKIETGHILLSDLKGFKFEQPLTMEQLEAAKEGILKITGDRLATMKQTPLLNWNNLVSLVSSQKDIELLINTYELVYQPLKNKHLSLAFKSRNSLPADFEEVSSKIQDLIIELIEKDPDLIWDLTSELKTSVEQRIKETNPGLFKKIENPSLKYISQNNIVHLASLIYKVTEEDRKGVCLGIDVVALMSIYNDPSNTKFKLFQDVFQDRLKRIAKYHLQMYAIKKHNANDPTKLKIELDGLAKTLMADRFVCAFLETALITTRPQLWAKEMLARKEKSIEGLPKQIMQEDVNTTNANLIMAMLSLLEPNSNIRELSEVAPLGFYSSNDLEQFFKSFADSLKQRMDLESTTLKYPISFLVCSIDHAILVTIDPNQKDQIIIRPNNLETQTASLEDLGSSSADEVEMEKDKRKSLQITIYTHADDLEVAKQWVLDWSKSAPYIELHSRGYTSTDQGKAECLRLAFSHYDNKASKIIKGLLELGFDPNFPIKLRGTIRSPLEFAIDIKQYECAKTLLSSPLIKVDNQIVHKVISEGNLTALKILVESNKINLNNLGRRNLFSVLMTAASTENLELVKYLLNQGLDVNYCHSLMDDTVLAYAVGKQLNGNLINLLLESGAKIYNINAITNLLDCYDESLKEKILMSGFDETARMTHSNDRKELTQDRRLIESIDFIYENSHRTVDDNFYSIQKESIHSALYYASKNHYLAGYALTARDKKEWESAMKNSLDQVVKLLRNDENRLEQFKNRTGIFDKYRITDSMHEYVNNNLKLTAQQRPDAFFQPASPAEKLDEPEFEKHAGMKRKHPN